MSGNGDVYIYVSESESNCIRVLRMAENGDLTRVQEVPVAGKVMPMAITPDRRSLFAAVRSEPMTIDSFAINGANGMLTRTGSVPAPESTVYLSTDRNGGNLLAAYNAHTKKTGLLTVHAISPNGTLQEPAFTIRTPPKIHAIMADPDNRFVMAPSCDGDVIMRYEFDPVAGELSPDGLAPVIVAPKAGPRHLQFHPNKKFMYLVNEYDASLIVYKRSGTRGALHEIQTASAAPTDRSIEKEWHGGWRAADLHFTPDGRWLYVSLRNTRDIVVFAVDPVTGLVSPKARSKTADEPRSFCIDPSGRFLFAVGMKEKCLVAFSIDAATGELTRTKDHEMGDGPNWIECIRL